MSRGGRGAGLARLRRVIAAAPFPIMLHAEDGTVLQVSRAWTEITGYRPEDIPTVAVWTERAYGERREPVRLDIDRLYVLDRRVEEGEYLVRTASGQERAWQFASAPAGHDRQGRRLVISMAADLTERKRAEAALRDSEARLKAVVETAVDGIVTIDEHGTIETLNPAARRIFGYAAAELLGRNVNRLMPEPYRSQHDGYLARYLATGERRIIGIGREVEGRRKDGTTFPLELAVSEARLGDRRVFTGIVRDISERRAAEERIARLALHDPLTGLPNRVLFQDRLAQALAAARRAGGQVAAMLLDLDGFKDVNDTLGHETGDRLLQAVAIRLAPILRASDTLARLGGDEFAIVQVGARQVADTAALADKLLRHLAEPCEVNGHALHIAASIGIALFPRDGGTPEALLRCADLALYRAKAEGRATFRFFEPGMDVKARARRQLEQELRLALERGEFLLHYQPQLDLASGRFTGAEALVRWRHPAQGLVLPGEFIPLAEATGLIRPLGAWVLQEACRQAAAWHAAGLPLTVAVNLSPAQLRSGDLPSTLARALRRRAGVAPRVELEITENVLMETLGGTAGGVLERLAASGVELAIDDFGTGYSSLAYLKNLPARSIKIDRSFVAGLGADAADAVLVRSMVGLAHGLGKRAVAEGVETEAQLAFLRAVGCDAVQGFLLARPQPAEELADLLARSRP